jgi:hypothetical protein
MALVVLNLYNSIFHTSNAMSTSNSPAPGPSTPGGELEQISPGATPTADGGQVENSAAVVPTPQSIPKSTPSAAKRLPDNLERSKGNAGPKTGV